MNAACRFGQRNIVLIVERADALAVDFDKIDSLFAKLPVPVVVEGRTLIRIWNEAAGRSFAQSLSFFARKAALRIDSVPVAAQRVPDAEPADHSLVTQFLCQRTEAAREFHRIRHITGESLVR